MTTPAAACWSGVRHVCAAALQNVNSMRARGNLAGPSKIARLQPAGLCLRDVRILYRGQIYADINFQGQN